MDLTPSEDADKLYAKALEALNAGETPAALAFLERALKVKDNPSWHSYLGYFIAKERGQVKKGSDLCQASLKVEPGNPVHYLNLAKVQLINRQKGEALKTLRQGMAAGGNEEISGLLTRLGTRKPPVLTFLRRDHFLNKYLGILLSRLRIR